MRTRSGGGNRPTLIQSSASPTKIRSKGLGETTHVPAAAGRSSRSAVSVPENACPALALEARLHLSDWAGILLQCSLQVYRWSPASAACARRKRSRSTACSSNATHDRRQEPGGSGGKRAVGGVNSFGADKFGNRLKILRHDPPSVVTDQRASHDCGVRRQPRCYFLAEYNFSCQWLIWLARREGASFA